MKRLFLASSGLTYITKFIGQDTTQTGLLFIPTAGNLDEHAWWIDKDRDVLSKMGFQITELDIEKAAKEQMADALNNTDIVFIAGGNTFFLLKQLRATGFDKLLTDYVNNGGLFAGASAGALVAGIDIEPVASLDEPQRVQGLESTAGLGFVNIVPIPHYNQGSGAEAIERVQEEFKNKYTMVLLNDDQAIVVNGDDMTIVESRRSELELEWFKRTH